MKKTGGGEDEGKTLTPVEDKLMGILSWVTVTGTEEVPELGSEKDNGGQEKAKVHLNGEFDDSIPIDVNVQEAIPIIVNDVPDEITVQPTTSSSSLKRTTVVKEQKFKRSAGGRTTSLQKAAEAFAVGQKSSLEIFEKLTDIYKTSMLSEELKRKELELKEVELKVRLIEARNKKEELRIREREINLEEAKLKQEVLRGNV